MQCYSELTPPTAVTHSLCLPFTSADANNLIVAKTSLLQIFTTKSITVDLEDSPERSRTRQKTKYDPTQEEDDKLEASFLGTQPILRTDKVKRTKLVLVAEYTLSGTITSLARIKTSTSKSGGESLLISLKDAKLSLVEWDPERHGLATVSIHYYEQDELQGSPWAPRLSECVNYLAADPGSRCAALKFGTRNLAILPFKQDDDDIHMDDWDEDLDGPRPDNKALSSTVNGGSGKGDTPYGSSFVLKLSQLDSNILFPIHLAFLHEYREPTFGILSSTTAPSSALLSERKDQLNYMVFTLDLQQKASTTILSVGGLPYDLHQVIPVPAPVGGALLVGVNEFVHIDQGGKANGVAVNMFAKQCTSFSLADQSILDMRLEGCTMEQLSTQNGDMLIVLHDGSFAILSFKLDGRSVSGITVRRVAAEHGGTVLKAGVSSATLVGSNTLFIGSEQSDSVVLGWHRKSNQTTRRKQRLDLGVDTGMDDANSEDDEDDDMDDDLYGLAPATAQAALNGTNKSKIGDYHFSIHDSLVSIAPIVQTTLGQPFRAAFGEETPETNSVVSELELVATVGKDTACALAIIHHNIQPKVIGKFDFPEARGIWTMNVKKPAIKGLMTGKEKSVSSGDFANDAQFDKLMIVSKVGDDASEVSDVYTLTGAGFEALSGTEFDRAGATIEANTLGNGMRVVQVSTSEVRSYDGNLALSQMMEMFDEVTNADPKIVSASFADPFILLLRDDSSIYVVHCDEQNDLEELEKQDDLLLSTNWLTGCLYNDHSGAFSSYPSADEGTAESIFMFLLSAEGTLVVYALPDLSKAVYVAEGICYVPPLFSANYTARKSAARDTLTEIVVADLGDGISRSPYLILRSSNDDLTIYQPFNTTSSSSTLTQSLHFLKIAVPNIAENSNIVTDEPEDAVTRPRDSPIRVIDNLAGYSTVFMPGSSPSFLLKSSKSAPKIIGLQGVGIRSLSSFHTEGCNRGFIYADVSGTARVAQLPAFTNFTDIGVPLRKISYNEPIHALSFHPPQNCYVIGTSSEVGFELPKDDDHHREWAREDVALKPTMEQSYVKLINPVNWSIVDTVTLDPFETILSMKTLNLEVSEVTNERKQLVVVGTGIAKGEDLAIKGRVYVFDVVDVVPEPHRPETNKKLKMIAKEDIPRGAVTGISSIGSQGFMLITQGQKCMVRGLKEDGTLLPVAFLDMNCYLTVVKELSGTGICLLGDAIKGVWVAGYTEEPYKMMLFGKSSTALEVTAGDFLPSGEELNVVVSDVGCNLHVLQYNPEHPKTQSGHFLLHRATFSLGGHMPTSMTLLPRTTSLSILLSPTETSAMDIDSSPQTPQHQILIASLSGSLSLLTPLTESQYRSLNTLTTHMSNTLPHHCGLNPRAYRVDRDAPAAEGGRTIVDGEILRRWRELGSVKRSEIAGKVGMDVDGVREDILLSTGWGGLGFL